MHIGTYCQLILHVLQGYETEPIAREYGSRFSFTVNSEK